MHARLRPSAAQQWINCPASVKLSERAREEETEYTKAGSLAHSIAESLLKGEMPESEDSYLISLAREYVDYVRAHTPPHGNTAVEETVYITDDIFGTPDCVIYSPGRIDVIDFKSGSGQIVTDFNQLRLYAVGAMKNYSERKYGRELEVVYLHIVQPALENYKVEECDPGALTNWFKTRALTAAHEAINAPGFSNPGSWCKFCSGRAYCYENGEKFRRFDKSAPLSELTVGEMGEILEEMEGLVGYRDQLKKAITKELENGTPVAGWELAPGRNRREWVKSERLTELARKQGLTTLLSPAQMQKKLGKKEFENTFGEYVKTVEGKLTLKHVEE